MPIKILGVFESSFGEFQPSKQFNLFKAKVKFFGAHLHLTRKNKFNDFDELLDSNFQLKII